MNVEKELEIMNSIANINDIEKNYSKEQLNKMMQSIEFLMKENDMFLNHTIKNFKSENSSKLYKIIQMKEKLFLLQKKSEIFLLHLSYQEEKHAIINALNKI